MKKRVLKPESARKNASPEQIQMYVEKLKKMIDCKTVFKRNGENDASFQKFYQVVEETFPLLTSKAEKLTFGTGCFFYIIKGHRAHKNVLLMSHHDVVEGTDGWDSDPFCAVEKDGALYGRGTVDTKTPLFAEMQAVEELLEDNWIPEGFDLYIGSSNNEEVCGDGMVLAVKWFLEKNIRFDVVLDEGGAVTSGMIPGWSGKSAMIAVHEKSRHMYRCHVSLDRKGHGGLNPDDENAIMCLSGFMQEVEKKKKKIFKSKFYPEVKATFETHAPYMSFPMNILFGHLGVFAPIIKKIMMTIPPARAMLASSAVFTTITAGSSLDPQIKAKEASSTLFVRCIREEDMEEEMEKIRKIAEKYGVEITLMERDYCRPSSFTSKQFEILEEVLAEDMPDVVSAPFLLTAGTDARRFTDIAEAILRFAPIDLDPARFASVHGDNENIGIENIGQCVCVYKDFIRRYEEEI